jgi:hypothetical protein
VQPFRHVDGVCKRCASAELIAQARSLQDAKSGLDCFARDIVARHPLAKTLCAVFKSGADDQIISVFPAMRGVSNGPLERNSNRKSAELDDSHGHFAFGLLMAVLEQDTGKPPATRAIYLADRQ